MHRKAADRIAISDSCLRCRVPKALAAGRCHRRPEARTDVRRPGPAAVLKDAQQAPRRVARRDGRRLAQAAARVGAPRLDRAAVLNDCHPGPADDRLVAVAALAADARPAATARADVHARRRMAQAEAATRVTRTAAGSHRAVDDCRQAATVADGAAAAGDLPSGHGRHTTGVRDSNGPSRSQSKR
ncbi:hypothetical protein K788_0004452 [Paraburkholderia caribensis MBA4]|uniref:Uncharacterized protein n=1 Tax=Paraburkholderia caribensis MBA4 TaxID=1323664 RepID=A0A0P0RAW6_9BURK|nr:hypothetical protein K788_0004452 [Paraburkholderia caribensis MBA4]